MKELQLKHLKYAYYLRGWKRFVWRLFINKVYPDWEEGHKTHQRLIGQGYLAHLDEFPDCSCK